MTERRFVLVDFRYTSDPLGHVRFYEAGSSYDMPRALESSATPHIRNRRSTDTSLRREVVGAGTVYK